MTVNGAVAGSPEQKYDRLGLDLRVDGAPIGAEKFVYLMLHKPGGVLSATEDPKQSTVVDLLPEYLRRVGLFPVGRLDKDTEGLLLLTNDGPLGHRLLAPGRHVDKMYFVRVEGTLTAEDAAAFAAGMTLGDGLRCMPAGLGAPAGAGHRPGDPAGGQVPPDQADARLSGKAGALPQAAVHGPAAAGRGPGTGRVAGADRRGDSGLDECLKGGAGRLNGPALRGTKPCFGIFNKKIRIPY